MGAPHVFQCNVFQPGVFQQFGCPVAPGGGSGSSGAEGGGDEYKKKIKAAVAAEKRKRRLAAEAKRKDRAKIEPALNEAASVPDLPLFDYNLPPMAAAPIAPQLPAPWMGAMQADARDVQDAIAVLRFLAEEDLATA